MAGREVAPGNVGSNVNRVVENERKIEWNMKLKLPGILKRHVGLKGPVEVE